LIVEKIRFKEKACVEITGGVGVKMGGLKEDYFERETLVSPVRRVYL
jgi:hypothetical protein